MAILDRPLFQRRPTMDQLRMYGLPAFANGGVVKYQTAGEIKVIDEEIITKKIDLKTDIFARNFQFKKIDDDKELPKYLIENKSKFSKFLIQ